MHKTQKFTGKHGAVAKTGGKQSDKFGVREVQQSDEFGVREVQRSDRQTEVASHETRGTDGENPSVMAAEQLSFKVRRGEKKTCHLRLLEVELRRKRGGRGGGGG